MDFSAHLRAKAKSEDLNGRMVSERTADSLSRSFTLDVFFALSRPVLLFLYKTCQQLLFMISG